MRRFGWKVLALSVGWAGASVTAAAMHSMGVPLPASLVLIGAVGFGLTFGIVNIE
jgi:hypothetical protein